MSDEKLSGGGRAESRERFREIVRGKVAHIETTLGHCCGDVINIYDDDLSWHLQQAMDEAYQLGERDMADLEKRYRRLLWESHAGYTHMPALYGDDGEMQCNHQLCGIDFKRQPLEQIEQHIFAVNLKRAALACKQ